MKQRQFAKGQRIVMGGREYAIEQSIPSGELQLKDIATNSFITRTEDKLVELLFQGHLELLNSESEETYAKRKIRSLLEADLAELPDKLRTETKRKYAYVTGIIEMGADSKTRKVFEPLIEAIARSLDDKNPPSYWQVYRWYTDYIASGEAPRSFFPRHSLKGNRKRKIQREVIELVDRVIAEKYLHKQRLTPHAVFGTVVARVKHENDLRAMAGNSDILKYPDESTVYRIIGKLSPYEAAKARYGKRYADISFMPKKEGIRPTRPLERVEIDHTKLDLFIVDLERRIPIGRPWLTLAIDVYSKCIHGIYVSFVPPSYHTLMQCMLHAVFPKTYVQTKFPEVKHTWDTYGIMETVVVDNGKEFHSNDFEDACLQLGIVIQYAPVKCPWYKPSVERFFGTLNTDLLHQQPGTSFSNIFEKDEYDSKKNAVISYETFMEMVHKWIIDIYHQDKHKGLMNTPAEVWKAGVQEFKPTLPESRKELEVMLGMIEYRKITGSGIELHNLFYNDENLMSIRMKYKNGVTEKVKVKYDPTDLSMVYVQDKFKKCFVPVRAVSQSYTQELNLWTHQVICRYARERLKLSYNVDSLSLAKEQIWKMANAEWNLTKRTGSRQKLARFFSIGQDDYGKIIEHEQKIHVPVHLPQTLVLASDPSLPSAEEHPANRISDIGTLVDSIGIRNLVSVGSEYKEIKKTDAEDIGEGRFVVSQSKKRCRRRPRKTRDNGITVKQNSADKASTVTAAKYADEELPDISEWDVSYVDLN